MLQRWGDCTKRILSIKLHGIGVLDLNIENFIQFLFWNLTYKVLLLLTLFSQSGLWMCDMATLPVCHSHPPTPTLPCFSLSPFRLYSLDISTQSLSSASPSIPLTKSQPQSLQDHLFWLSIHHISTFFPTSTFVTEDYHGSPLEQGCYQSLW